LTYRNGYMAKINVDPLNTVITVGLYICASIEISSKLIIL
jgi:hypothetical protein